jgi:hypothetical protein
MNIGILGITKYGSLIDLLFNGACAGEEALAILDEI